MVDSQPFVPAEGQWSEKDITKHPFDAVIWARKQRANWSERALANDSRDMGWSRAEADRCTAGLAEADRVEAISLRGLFGRADGLLRTLFQGFDSTDQFCKFHKIDKRWTKDARELLLASQKLGKV